VKFGRKKEKLLRVTMDKLYDMLMQVGYLPIKNQVQERVIIFIGSTK